MITDTPLLVRRLLPQDVIAMAPSFKDLPETDHKDGKYRLRKYSTIKPYLGNIVRQPKRSFTQSEDINKFQGGMSRSFDELDEKLIRGNLGFANMCKMFLDGIGLEGGSEIEVHQMRVVTRADKADVSPEGIHQDGVDHIAIIGINRVNVSGGELLVYKEATAKPCITWELNAGDMMIIDDRKFFHNANPIKLLDETFQTGYLDAFILTART